MAKTVYPAKIDEAIKLLVEEGYFKNKKDLINISLFHFLKDNDLFKAVNTIKLRKMEEK